MTMKKSQGNESEMNEQRKGFKEMPTSYWSDIQSMVEFYDVVGFFQAYFAGYDAVGVDGDGHCRSLPYADFDICNGKVMIATIDEYMDIIDLIPRDEFNFSVPYAEFSHEFGGNTGLRRWTVHLGDRLYI